MADHGLLGRTILVFSFLKVQVFPKCVKLAVSRAFRVFLDLFREQYALSTVLLPSQCKQSLRQELDLPLKCPSISTYAPLSHSNQGLPLSDVQCLLAELWYSLSDAVEHWLTQLCFGSCISHYFSLSMADGVTVSYLLLPDEIKLLMVSERNQSLLCY